MVLVVVLVVGVVVRGGRAGLLLVAVVAVVAVLILCGLGGGVGVLLSSSSLSLFAVVWAEVVVGRVGRVGRCGEEEVFCGLALSPPLTPVVLKCDTEVFRTVTAWLVHKSYNVKQHW